MNYDKEQGYADGEDDPLSADLKPWLRREWNLDVFVDEFPYFQYAGQDFPAESDEKVQRALAKDYRPDDPSELGDYVIQRGPYRTDVVGVSVDRRALRTRIRRLGHTTSLNGSQQTKRRRRRTYLTFAGDGPMTREYWETGHGGGDELRSYGEDSARRAFGWLKKRRFLASVGGQAWDAVDIPLHIHGRTHAFELKLDRGEWDTALEQASRADCFADYRWVVYDSDTADRALANSERFQSEGVGLISVHPEDGVQVHVWARQCTREVDREILDRYNVERWDLNERVMKRLDTIWTANRGEHEHRDPGEVSGPDILAELGPEDIQKDPEPPTVHGYTAGSTDAVDDTTVDPDHKPLTAFGADGE